MSLAGGERDGRPGNVCGVKYGEALRILLVCDAQISLEAEDFGIADVGPVEERA